MTNEIIMEYGCYVNKLASKYFSRYNNKEDLFQVGCIGLIMAYKKYDPNLGSKFTTYAFNYILGEMYKLVREDKGLKISQNITRLNFQIEKASLYLSQKLMRNPTMDELSEFLKIDTIDIIETKNACRIIESIDEPINRDGKIITLQDTIKKRDIDIDTLISLKQELNNLNENDRYLLEGSLNNYTQEELAGHLGINQVQVSRQLTKIKQKIKTNVA